MKKNIEIKCIKKMIKFKLNISCFKFYEFKICNLINVMDIINVI